MKETLYRFLGERNPRAKARYEALRQAGAPRWSSWRMRASLFLRKNMSQMCIRDRASSSPSPGESWGRGRLGRLSPRMAKAGS